MTDFKLDTSGVVLGVRPNEPDWPTTWNDLPPFVQGSIEEALEEAQEDLVTSKREIANDQPEPEDESDESREAFRSLYPIGFSDISPETLAMFVEDEPRARLMGFNDTREDGALHWRENLSKRVTLYLRDDGKVHHREAGR